MYSSNGNDVKANGQQMSSLGNAITNYLNNQANDNFENNIGHTFKSLDEKNQKLR